MLTELRIENLGVIDKVHLLLGPGLTALTGETGAGKTMLVEAINLLVGGRADPVMVRPGADEARVEGRFVQGDVELVLARVVPSEGRSRAYVDGRLANASTLAELGASLVDLHVQHAHQSLLAAAAQRRSVDRFGGVDLEPWRAARQRLTEVRDALAGLGGDARARAREIDLLRFQVDELDAAALEDPDEDVTLEADEELLASATEHRLAGERALELLTGDEGVVDRLGVALAELDGHGAFRPEVERLRSVAAELADVAADARGRVEGIEEDPARLAQVRARRQLLLELRRKYGDTLSDVMAYRAETASRLAELEGYEDRARELEARAAEATEEVDRAARSVGNARRGAFAGLASAVEAHLSSLAMPKARLRITADDEAADPAAESVVFELAANPGAPPLPLAKVASGGELARTMLALRLVLTEAPDTLVFDEVDAGIGGAAANAVAAALSALGERHQVLVVTHLAQVAAAADAQVAVEKAVVGAGRHEQTVARAIPVTGEARVDEVARMLSGGAAAESARQHARDLLDREHPRSMTA